MASKNRVELNSDVLDFVTGGAIGYDPDNNGTYTMRCQFTGNVYYGVSLSTAIEIAKYAANYPNNLEGEQQILAWAQGKGLI